MANFSPDFPRHSFWRVDTALSPPFLSGWYFTARMGPCPFTVVMDRRSAEVQATCLTMQVFVDASRVTARVRDTVFNEF